MPIVFTYDLTGATPPESNRIQSFFERLGWQNLGGSAYRYPPLGTQPDNPVEDWFNHVIPALMLFRTYIIDSKRELPKFTLDVQSSIGRDSDSKFGTSPQSGEEVTLCDTRRPQFGEAQLRKWLNDITYPYGVGD